MNHKIKYALVGAAVLGVTYFVSSGTSSQLSSSHRSKLENPVQLIVPNGGEVFLMGEPNVIRWTGGSGKVKIYAMTMFPNTTSTIEDWMQKRGRKANLWERTLIDDYLPLISTQEINSAIPQEVPQNDSWVYLDASLGATTWDARSICGIYSSGSSLCAGMSLRRAVGPIKLLIVSENGSYDWSDERFVVTGKAPAAPMKIISPNGGETWKKPIAALSDPRSINAPKWETFKNRYSFSYVPEEIDYNICDDLQRKVDSSPSEERHYRSLDMFDRALVVNLLKDDKFYRHLGHDIFSWGFCAEREVERGRVYEQSLYDYDHTWLPNDVQPGDDYKLELIYYGGNGQTRDVSDAPFRIR